MPIWNFTPVKELNGQTGTEDLGTLSECDGWSLIELVSFSGLPWDAYIDLSRQGHSLPRIKVSVSGLARVCVFATSAKVYAVNTTTQTHNVQAMVAPINAPIETDNVYIETVIGISTVTPPPGTTRLEVMLNNADPSLPPLVLIETTDRFATLTRSISLDQMPSDGLLIGSVETVAVTLPMPIGACLVWHLAF